MIISHHQISVKILRLDFTHILKRSNHLIGSLGIASAQTTRLAMTKRRTLALRSPPGLLIFRKFNYIMWRDVLSPFWEIIAAAMRKERQKC